MKDIRKNSCFILHLEHNRNGFTFCCVVKGIDIVLVFVERTPADTCLFCGLLYRHTAFLYQPPGLQNLQQDFRNGFFSDQIIGIPHETPPCAFVTEIHLSATHGW